jgi:hypothetical protein
MEDTGGDATRQAPNIVDLRDAAIKAALHRYAHARTTAERFAALMALANARCMGVDR